MTNIVEYSSKATAKRGAARMGVPADRIEDVIFKEGDKFTIDKAQVDKMLGLEGKSEEDENLILTCGHSHCPECKTHLSNGLMDYDSLVDQKGEKEAWALQKHEWSCMGCNAEWGAEIAKPKNRPAPKGDSSTSGRTYTDRAKSTVESPVKIVWDIADANPSAKRKEIVTMAIARGVTENTAKTQYQYWRKARGLVKG